MKSQEFAQKVLPFLKNEYFLDRTETHTFDAIKDYIFKYNRPPTFEALQIFLEQNDKLSKTEKLECQKLTAEFTKEEFDQKDDWLLDATEKFCQEKALYNGMMKAIEIMDGKSKDLAKGAIPQILQDALAVTFDPHVGMDYFDDAGTRYDLYHRPESKIPFDLSILNKVTKGGVPEKTLNVLVGGVNVGKSLALCHLASGYLAQGKDVLYVTLELSEEMVTQRIDSNLMNISTDDLMLLSREAFQKRVETLKSKTNGNLIVKEFPTSTASVLHIKALLNELYLKKNFKPDVVLVDYINIMSSSRIKMGGSTNSYTYIKAIAEELRGLAVEMGVRIWTATQLTRQGFNNSDPDMTDVAESFGLPATADFMIVIVSNDDLEALGQYMFKVVKTRYNKKAGIKSFVVGVDYDRMKLYDVEQATQPKEVMMKDLVTGSPNVEKPNKFSGLKI